MRILVLQLARFGDIYQTWPCLNALKRTRPEAEIHVLVRSRFKAALNGLGIAHVHELPTADILKSVYERGDEKTALAALDSFLSHLPEFDEIINLSFSPVSSYLTDALSTDRTQVRGYTRHGDGYFAIPDDASAYFHAQVGIGRANRFHLTEVFAAVAGVELQDADVHCVKTAQKRAHRIVVHLGASQQQKIYPAEMWVEALKLIAANYDGEIVLIGSKEEKGLAATVGEAVLSLRNLTGQTELTDVMKLLSESELLIGADSAPVHMAALTGTRVLNLSSSTVNFRETGPLTSGSRVLYADQMSAITSKRVAEEALALVRAFAPQGPCYVLESRTQGYVAHDVRTEDFAWNLVQALYTGTPYPKTDSTADRLAFQRLFELAELALQQITNWDSTQFAVAARVLTSVDEMLKEIPRICPNVEPVVQWFETQRLRLPPDTPENTRAATRRLFEELLWISAVYREDATTNQRAQEALTLTEEIAPELREYEFFSVEPKFQRLLSLLHELSRHSTNVGEKSWAAVVTEVQSQMAAQDFIALADLFEYELAPALESLVS